jgi:hypothetical protein
LQKKYEQLITDEKQKHHNSNKITVDELEEHVKDKKKLISKL